MLCEAPDVSGGAALHGCAQAAATDFPHVDSALLERLFVLVFIEHGTRRIRIHSLDQGP
ncbi:hypothetical protein [Actinospica robiniae]|uniref:hypothetical protein n=1 Tax=Actinospica robiniae TaxID=304901 RepID=UPI0003F61831|nr:hypothetical protein [Actinospica robiniae]